MAFSISPESCEKHLNCSICMEVFSDPRALPCMHTFCQTCLQTYITSLNSKTNIQYRGFECPVCRQITKAPIRGIAVDEWAANFTPNYTVKGLIDEHTEALARQNSNLGDGHKNSSQFCDTHTARTAEFKCEDHKPVRIICAVCAARKHKRCALLIYLGDEESTSENGEDIQLSESIDLPLPAAKHRSLTRLAHIKLREERTDRQANNKRLLEDFYRNATDIFDRKDGVLRRQNVTHKTSHKSVRRLNDNPHPHSFEECEDLRKLSANVAPYAYVAPGQNIRDVIAAAPSTSMSLNPNNDQTENFSEVAEGETTTLTEGDTEPHDQHRSLKRLVQGAAPHSFSDNEDLRRLSAKHNDKSKTENGFGSSLEATVLQTNITKRRPTSSLRKEMSIITESPEDDLIAPSAHICSDAVLSMKSTLTPSGEFKIMLDEDIRVCSVTGICSMPDGRALLADYSNYKVKLFDNEYVSRAYITLPSEPWDIDAIGDCEAVVSLPNAMCLFTLIIDNKITVGRRIDIDRQCYGVVFSNMQFIIACISDVRIFNYSGDFITRILKDRKSIFHNPGSVCSNFRYICLDKTDSNKMYISDNNRGLLCVSRNGEVQSFHSSPDNVFPQGLTACRPGSTLVVCQAPKQVTLYAINEHGCRTKDILYLENAQALSFNKRDQKLWVTMSDCDSVFIYTIKN